MKRAIIQITMEYPANRSWSEYVTVSGGQTVKSDTKVIEDVELGEVDPPWGQKMREMYTVRKIISEAIKASINIPDLIINVQGSTAWNNGAFVYYASFSSKTTGYANLPKQARALEGITWTLEPGGSLIWERDRGGNPKKITTMQVGDPDISEKIKNYLLKIYEKW